MNRKDWSFQYPASTLSAAARAKLAYHEERLTFWKNAKDEVLGRIRSEGIEVDEKRVLGFRNPKERDWDRGAKVMVRNDLQLELDECLEKLGHHTGKRTEYAGWSHALEANPDSCFQLDIDDWLYFFDQQ